MWEAMHGAMRGFYEARTRGPDRRLYRLVCVLEREAPGIDRPSIRGDRRSLQAARQRLHRRRLRARPPPGRGIPPTNPAERRVVGGYAGSNGALAVTAVGPRRAARPKPAPRRRRARAAASG